MPKRTLNIRTFDKGIISSVPYSDIPDNAATWHSSNAYLQTHNINPNANGKLQGLPQSSIFNANAYAQEVDKINGWIKKDDGKYTLVFDSVTGTDIDVIEDFYGTPASTASVSTNAATSIITRNQEAHVGCGSNNAAWVGYLSDGIFGGATPTAIYAVSQRLLHYHNIGSPTDGYFTLSAIASAGTSEFDSAKAYHWTYSLVYDGYQESPLNEVFNTVRPDSTEIITVTLTALGGATNPTAFNQRITGVRVYRSQYTDGFSADSREFFRLIKEIDINDGSWSTSGSDKVYTFTDDNTVSGTSYEAQTGISEEALYSYADYTISAEVNGYHFIANCVLPIPEIDDGAHFLIRSKRERFNMFDLVNDFLRLPTVPTAMAGHNGRLFVWDSNRTYVINPEGLYIEQTLEGSGCVSHTTWVSTNYGLFWADSNRAYRYYNNSIEEISLAIETDFPAIDQVIFDAEYNFVMFFSGNNVWTYHVTKNRWDYIGTVAVTTVSGNTRGAFAGRYGETYCATDSATLYLVKLFGGTTKRGWGFSSKEFAIEEVGQYKVWYYLLLRSTGTITTTFSTNPLASTPTWTAIGVDNKIDDGSGNWIKAKSIKFNMTAAAGDNIVDDFEITFRTLVGKYD